MALHRFGWSREWSPESYHLSGEDAFDSFWYHAMVAGFLIRTLALLSEARKQSVMNEPQCPANFVNNWLAQGQNDNSTNWEMTMGSISQQLWNRYISESLARSDHRSEAIESRLARFAIESRVADLLKETPAFDQRIFGIRNEVAQLREALGNARDTLRCAAYRSVHRSSGRDERGMG